MAKPDSIPAFSRLVRTETISTASQGTRSTLGARKAFVISVDGPVYFAMNDGSTYNLTELKAANYTTLAFTAPDQIVRTGGSWTTDGYTAGRYITITDAATAANNATFEIESTTATALTTVEVTLATEGASTTERVNGYRNLEAAATDSLIPEAGLWQQDSGHNIQIRFYNPSAVTSVISSIFECF